MNILRSRPLASLILAAACGHVPGRTDCPHYLRCEYLVDPLGVDETSPRLSWLVSSSRRGECQTAWQILVAGTEDNLARDVGDLWDSGRVEGGDTIGAVYQGRPLVSGEFCHWKVRGLGRGGQAFLLEQAGGVGDGVVAAGDWRGDWIGFDKMRVGKRPCRRISGMRNGFGGRGMRFRIFPKGPWCFYEHPHVAGQYHH